MNERPTPETDAEFQKLYSGYLTHPATLDLQIAEKFAHNLERQRDEAIGKLAMLVAEVLAQRDELLEALETIKRRVPIMGSRGDYREGQLHALEACSEVANAAIAAVKGGKL